MDTFYESLAYPATSRLDRRIPKRMVMDHAELTPADKKALTEDVEKLTWKYALKPTTIAVAPYADDEREYLEVAIIEVELRSRSRAERVAELIQRAVPYPVLLLLVHGDRVSVNVAHKRFSRAEAGRIVATGILQTPWMTLPLTGIDADFSASLRLSKRPLLNFLVLYEGMVAAVLARMCADISGQYRIEPERREEDRRRALERHAELEREIRKTRAALKEENRFAEKVQLNTRIKALEGELGTARKDL